MAGRTCIDRYRERKCRPDEQGAGPAGRATRLLRLLRAHGFIRRASKTLYYSVTLRGNQIMATALRLRQIPTLALVP